SAGAAVHRQWSDARESGGLHGARKPLAQQRIAVHGPPQQALLRLDEGAIRGYDTHVRKTSRDGRHADVVSTPDVHFAERAETRDAAEVTPHRPAPRPSRAASEAHRQRKRRAAA